ncbi:MAG: UvrD-helicase domain-containing protein [Desulfovermiculus sp.]|nr:UvrD-helicase domain-containing protein [Desulfovermiculus sp.]
MTTYTADLHIHSRYSRATSKALSIPHLAAWAGVKGVDVLTTGDFTHPGWLQEIEDTLDETGDGLLRLKDPSCLAKEIPWLEPQSQPGSCDFILGTEISSIYKRQGSVRKVHNLVFFSSLDTVRTFNRRLGQVGNLQSDGRPILGLDSRDLLEMVLETDPLGFLIPAHIWTPWFSLFGSKSGFDRLSDCFQDLSNHIFALETGLSSDPEMNWLWSDLDAYTLVSNSDAHSGEKLAREANLFAGQPSYEHILQALQGNSPTQPFLGSIEFFPQEGKYHLDGHRKCGVVLDPRETAKLGGVCPVCGDKLTVGVLNRILALADRDIPQQPQTAPGFTSLIPLAEVISEILGKGPRTKAVTAVYARLIKAFGSELQVLRNTPVEDLKTESPALAEGIDRMRRQEVYRKSGFDGEFGQISVFTPVERRTLTQGRSLGPPPKQVTSATRSEKNQKPGPKGIQERPATSGSEELNPEQWQAVQSGPHPILVIAGPGTGKTKTLIGRVQHLIHQGQDPADILVVTFTRDAARELQERLQGQLNADQRLPRADTLHALAFEQWRLRHGHPPIILSEQDARQIFAQVNPELSGRELNKAWDRLSRARESGHIPSELLACLQTFSEYKASYNLADYTDLLHSWLKELQGERGQGPFAQVLVDEVQDLTQLQAEIVRALLPKDGNGFFGIGDPNQSIYGFRGALGDVLALFGCHWPELETVALYRNYRSRQEILDFSSPLCPASPALQAQTNEPQASLTWYQAESGAQEAYWIAEQIKDLIGGTGHLQADVSETRHLPPGDIAVLVRLKALMPPLQKALDQQGVPCSIPESSPFWHDEQSRLILRSIARSLSLPFDQGQEILDCPERIMEYSPQELARIWSQDHRFHHTFWSSQVFQDLCAAFDSNRSWTALLAWIHLEEDAAHIRHQAQKVRLLTLHAAKGLEFEAVFLPALEQGILPFAGPELFAGKNRTTGDAVPDPEEEKRLFYVGLTRPHSQLFMSCAKRRILGRLPLHLPPSRFVQELNFRRVNKVRRVARTRQRVTHLSLLDGLE